MTFLDMMYCLLVDSRIVTCGMTYNLHKYITSFPEQDFQVIQNDILCIFSKYFLGCAKMMCMQMIYKEHSLISMPV